MRTAGVTMDCDRRELAAAPARDASAPTTATLKMDLTSICSPHENCWIPGENKALCPKLVLLFLLSWVLDLSALKC